LVALVLPRFLRFLRDSLVVRLPLIASMVLDRPD
jgi:hypothetical protein